MKPQPFKIDVSQSELDDLKQRLINTRWPRDLGNQDWLYGFNAEKLKSLVDYWINDYDWRQVEQKINAFEHFKVNIDDVPIHYIYQAGKGPAPVPLIINHGWPSTFWEAHKIIDALADPAAHGGDPADAFDVIVASLPGFGFSTPLNHAGFNASKVTDVLHKLMTQVLGYPRFAASGGDWGSRMTSEFGHKYASSVYGIHILGSTPIDLFSHERYWDLSAKFIPYDTPEEIRKIALPSITQALSHACVQSLEPQTLAYAMHDSPVGQLAWIAQRYRDWGDTQGNIDNAFERDFIITTAMIYWVTESFETSIRYYRDAALYPWQPSHNRQPRIEAPTGITFLGGENPPGVSTEKRVDFFKQSEQAADYNLHFVNAHETGGHFGYYENPTACIDDIRATFRELR